jgi:hypothetical protein
MVQGVLNGAQRGLRVVVAVQIVTGSQLQDDAFHGHFMPSRWERLSQVGALM